MPSAEPTRLTDDLWLAAHDSLRGKPHISERALGVGLATGLLAELIGEEFLELRDGKLFRTTRPTRPAPADPALGPLLDIMTAEERNWPPPAPRPPARARAAVRARDDGDRDWPPWPSQPPQHRSQSAPPDERQRRRGHDLRVWMAYLATEQRAEQRVIERLSHAGLVERTERRRLFGGTRVRYLPYGPNIAGRPANMITSAMRSRHGLSWQALVLAGLFLATGLHHHALITWDPGERSQLAEQLQQGLDAQSWELLCAADAAVGEAAMR